MRQINSQLTRDKVISELRREILYGNLQANQELYQDKIAEELGVSRMPVREALQILHNEGLVTVKPNKVATVNEISGKFLRDHFEMRSMLEQEAMRRACHKTIDCTPLWDNYYKAESAINNHDFYSFNEYNRQIHQAIWQAADNIQLEKMLSQMWNTMMADHDSAEEFAKKSNEEHKKMIECIQSHDEATGMQTIAKHVERSYQGIQKRLSKEDVAQ